MLQCTTPEKGLLFLVSFLFDIFRYLRARTVVVVTVSTYLDGCRIGYSLTRVEKGETGFYTAVETDSSIKHASAQS